MQEFKLNTPYIKLDQLLKAVGICDSGGEAKAIITGGNILVNGEKEIRRGRKIKSGDLVGDAEKKIKITVL